MKGAIKNTAAIDAVSGFANAGQWESPHPKEFHCAFNGPRLKARLPNLAWNLKCRRPHLPKTDV
jgi:hypothetical protein